MPLEALRKRIKNNRRLANRFHRMAKRRHFRAAEVAKKALSAKQDGYDVKARHLIRRALRLKAMASRTGMQSKVYRERMKKLKVRFQKLSKQG